jgi:ankyrin repeat protein
MDTRQDTTLIMQAIEKNNKAALLFLLEVMPKSSIDAKDSHGKSAVYLAIYYRYNDLLKILLNAGANPNIQNNLGWTPLMQARFQRNYQAIDMLLSAKADTNIKNFNHESVYEMNFADNNPYITPIVFNKITTLRNLLQDTPPRDYSYLIQVSLKLKKYQCLEALLNQRPNLSEENYLETALYNNDFNSFELLLKFGANPNSIDNFGNSILHTSVYLKKHKHIRALLEFKANVNVVDRWGDTPLMLAIKRNDPVSINVLAENKPNLSFQNSMGESVLSLIENQKWLEEKSEENEKDKAVEKFSYSFFSQHSQSISLTTGAVCVGFLAYHLLRRAR